MNRPLGIDLSSHNHDRGPIDYAAVRAAGVEFAVVKITEYPGYVNPFARADVSNLSSEGIEVAGYLFLHPASDPVAAANYYLNMCNTIKVNMVGVGIDLEVTDGALTQAQIESAYLRCATVLRDAGKKVALYTDRSMWPWLPHLDYQWLGAPLNQAVTIRPADTAEYSLPSVFSAPAGSIHCWQYGQAAVPGIPGLTDVNLWLDPVSYQAFFNLQPDPPPEVDMPITAADVDAIAAKVLLEMRQEFTPTSELFGRVVEAAQKAFKQTPLTITVTEPPAPAAAPTPAAVAGPPPERRGGHVMNVIEARLYAELNAADPDCTISAGPYPHVYLGCSQIALHVVSSTCHTRHDRLKALSDYLGAVKQKIDDTAAAELLAAIREAKALHPATCVIPEGSGVWAGSPAPEGPEPEPF